MYGYQVSVGFVGTYNVTAMSLPIFFIQIMAEILQSAFCNFLSHTEGYHIYFCLCWNVIAPCKTLARGNGARPPSISQLGLV